MSSSVIPEKPPSNPKSKVPRYRAGQLPKYLQETDTNEDDDQTFAKPIIVQKDRRTQRLDNIKIERTVDHRSRQQRQIEEPEILGEGVLSSEDEAEEQDDQKPEIITSELAKRRARERIAASVITSKDEEDEDEEDEDESEHDRRRERLRQRMLQRQEEEEESVQLKQEEEDEEQEDDEVEARRRRERSQKRKAEVLQPGEEIEEGPKDEDEEQEQEEEEESEYEEVSEEEGSEEEDTRRIHITPVFKPKTERKTIQDQLKSEQEAEQAEKERLTRLDERKKQSKELLKEEIKRNKEETTGATNNGDVADQEPEEDENEEEDEATKTEEYEKWKIRELARIKREREEREAEEHERSEIERRRKLSDNEIIAEDAETRLKPKEKKQWKFLQKYYHKGAYFRTFDEKDDLMKEEKWDFSQATLEDRGDKSILPKVMQVKNFGRSGRTKYTHLKDQDTTDFDSAWSKMDPSLKDKYSQKMGGVGSVSDALSKRRKKDNL